MTIKQLKQIEILSFRFSIEWDDTNDGGSFNLAESSITIGIKSMDKDPLYTFSVLSHEIMEVVLLGLGARYSNKRTGDNYLFMFDHQTFENAIQIHAQAISKFISND
jgi:hypothetical protein